MSEFQKFMTCFRKKVIRCENRLFLRKQKKCLYREITENKSENTIYYFCIPVHSNLGDQAQLFCWQRLFAEWYPSYKLISIACEYLTEISFTEIRKRIKPNDKILIHSGYLIFDPHPHLPFIRKIVDAFRDFPIVILPQTININDDKVVSLTQDSFNSHPNLTIIARDEVSKDNADRLFPNCKRLLMPDVVTSLIGSEQFAQLNSNRDGVLFCIRNDGEKFYSAKQISDLRERFGTRTDICDTTIVKDMYSWTKKREKYIRSILKRFSKYKVIITDRYHGTIFSQITNTPVIVLSSTDHKLSSGVNWFPKEIFGNNVFFAENLNKAYTIASEILDKNIQVNNPPYFKESFYSSPLI